MAMPAGHDAGLKNTYRFMAKGNMLLGKATGSVGDITFSVVNGRQVIKSKPASVKNRQTKAQMVQRILMNTVAQAYSKMADICDHSFEGIAYGADSMAYFMRKNLKFLRNQAAQYGLDADNAPNVVPLGTSYLATNEYIISKGTLPEIFMVASEANRGFSIAAGNTYAGVISQLGAQRGDQITCLAIVGTNAADLRFVYARIILDPREEDGTPADLSTAFCVDGVIQKANSRNENYGLTFSVENDVFQWVSSAPTLYVSCRAAILSRKNEDETWMRSPASLVYGEDLLVGYTIEEAYDDFLSGGIEMTSSRYLNNATRGASQQDSPSPSPSPTPTPGADSLTVDDEAATIGGSKTVEEGETVTVVLTTVAGSSRIGKGMRVGDGAIQTIVQGANQITIPAAVEGQTKSVVIGTINGSTLSDTSVLFSAVCPGSDPNNPGDGDAN